MQIVNGTKRVISIMTPQGKVLSIKPGTISDPFAASRSMILAAINSGSSKEIGIVVPDSFEAGMAYEITGGMAYYYRSANEALAKIIDPTIDYTKSQVTDDINSMRDALDAEKMRANGLAKELDEVKAQLEEAKKASAEDPTNELKLRQAMDEVEHYKGENTSLKAELEGLKSNNETLSNQYNNAKSEANGLQTRVDLLVKSDADQKAKIAELEKDLESAKAKEVDVTPFKNEIASLKEQLESVKQASRDLCEKFHLEFNPETGEWTQKLPEE